MDDVLFGAEFEKKIVAPTGSWIAVKFATLIDPAIQVDMFCDKPWFYSPLVCSMNTMRVMNHPTLVHGAAPSKKIKIEKKKAVEEISISGPDPANEAAKTEFTSISLGSLPNKELTNQICPWIWADNNELTEDNSLLSPDQPFHSESAADRRKYFQKQKNRASNIFSPEYVYNFEVLLVHVDLCTIHGFKHV
jgi:hypothetical protein